MYFVVPKALRFRIKRILNASDGIIVKKKIRFADLKIFSRSPKAAAEEENKASALYVVPLSSEYRLKSFLPLGWDLCEK